MNYLGELDMFYDWVETETISANAILLWRTLIAIANRSGRETEFSVTLSTLESHTKLHKATICRVRDELVRLGLLSYQSRGGRHSALYKLTPFELHGATQSIFGSQLVSHTATQSMQKNKVVSHHATRNNDAGAFDSHLASSCATQVGTQSAIESQIESHSATQNCPNPELVSQTAIQKTATTADNKKDSKNPTRLKKQKKVPIYNISINNTEEEIRYIKFKEWVYINAPNVAKMREPFSQVQYDRLFSEYPRSDIIEILLAMHNYADLRKKNNSAYLTARNWLNRRLNPPDNQPRGETKMGKVDKVLSVLKQIEDEQNANQRGTYDATLLADDNSAAGE